MKDYILYISIVFFLSLFSSCDRGLLDDMPLNKKSAYDIFKDSTRVDDFVLGLYTYLPGVYNRFDGEAMLSSATDESTQCKAMHGVRSFNDGSLQPTSHPDMIWADAYAGIRQANLLLDNIGSLYASTSDEKRNAAINEARFVRAFLYFELIKRYAGVPLLKRTYSYDENPNIPRNTFAECIKFIVDECDSVAKYLPTVQPESQMGRASGVAAMALKARTLLYAASPLFNGPSIEGKNDPIVGYGSYNPNRWEDAAKAASELLQHYPGTIDLYRTGTAIFKYGRGFYTPAGNKELLFVKTRAKDNNIEKINAPVGYTNAIGGVCPSQNLIDAYEMSGGKTYDPNAPYSNRDPRFYATIQYNGATWWDRKVETFMGGLDAEDATLNATKTGYYLRKFSDPEAIIFGATKTGLHYFPYFRVAEVLLNYAEAMNEAYGPETDYFGNGRTAKWAIDEVRSRVSMPSLPEGLSYSEMKDRIMHERQIELAFEEHRHWDLRRWKKAKDILNGLELKGITITRTIDEPTGNITYTYTPKVVEKRVFTDKMYLYPIHTGEILKNKALVQNPLW